MNRTDRHRIETATAEAALRVPGVAYLSPRLLDRLRSTVPGPAGHPPPTAGVRAVPSATGDGWELDIAIAVAPGHQAAAVAAAVRRAVVAVAPQHTLDVIVTVTAVA